MTPALEDWFATRGRWQRLGISTLCGALMTAGHAPVDLPWLLFLGVPVLTWLVCMAPNARAAFWIGWGAGFGYFVTGLHWVGHAFLVEPDRFLWLIPLGVAALPAGLALFWGLAFWIARHIGPRDGIPAILCLAATWTAVEYARANILTGFPWALPGYVWVDTPVMQAASWAGPFGMTLLTLVLTALPLRGLATGKWVWTAASLAGLAGLWIAGTARLPDEVVFAPDAPVIRLVQPNAPQAEKWVPGRREVFYQRALDATAAPPHPELGLADVVIWPETAVYFLPEYNPEEVKRISESARNAPVILGALHGDTVNGVDRWLNSMFVIGRDGTLSARYDKHHLVPFGEYLPFSGFFDWVGLSQFGRSGRFMSGPGPQSMSIPGLPGFSALICYEAIFPQEVVADGPRPAWLVQITNDAWFGSFAGPHQHLDQARIRAIEQGLPMVRAANTGISAIISPHGLLVESIPLNNHGGIDAKLPGPLAATLYSRYGDLLALFLIVFLLIFSGFKRFISKRR